jgi:hypothetical protein
MVFPIDHDIAFVRVVPMCSEVGTGELKPDENPFPSLAGETTGDAVRKARLDLFNVLVKVVSHTAKEKDDAVFV